MQQALNLPSALILSIVLLLVSIICNMALAKESNAIPAESQPQAITLAAEDSWPPFANQFGQGISHRLIQAAFKQSHIEVNSLVVPYSRALMMAEKVQLMGCLTSPARTVLSNASSLEAPHYLSPRLLFIKRNKNLFWQTINGRYLKAPLSA